MQELRHDWGIVEKCPYCPRTGIQRTGHAQVTCGRESCQLEHRARLRSRKLKQKAKRRAEAKAKAG